MTRGFVAKRPRLGNTSPVSLPTNQPTTSLPYPSRASTASSHAIHETVAISGVADNAEYSANAPFPTAPSAQPQSRRPAQHHHQDPSTQDAQHSPLHHNVPGRGAPHKSATPLTIATSQQTASAGIASAPLSSTSSSYPPQPLDRYQQTNGHQQSAPPSATQASFPSQHTPITTLPPLTSPASAPPGNSSSAPPLLANPHALPPQPDYYPTRGPYPGPQPPYPSGTPTNGSFASRQQSAPSGAPASAEGMIMDHPPPHHAPVYGHGHFPADAGPPGPAPNMSHPNAPPPYQPVQPVEQYGQHAAVPQSYPPQQMPPAGYHPVPGSGAANWNAQQKSAGLKKHTRAHVACNACRTRKQKCDEQTPSCSYCTQEGLVCEYRQVQPPKADRNLAGLQDQQTKLENEFKLMRNDMAHMLQLLKSSTNTSSVNGQTSSRRQSAGLNSDQTEELDTVQEQSPGAHSTGAQHLSKKFPMTEAWFTAVVKQPHYEDYPYELEQKRGTPRIFGTGWSGDEANGRSERSTAYNNSFRTGSHPAKNKGGLNPNGSLRLDQSTIKRYHDSYMRNMWVIYPIFNAEDLKQRMTNFSALYSPDEDVKPETPPLPQHSAHSPHLSAGLKRSFSEMHGETDDAVSCGDPKRAVDASLNNAVILLVLALGKLCEHDKYIMSEDLVGKNDPFPEDASSQGSSPQYARPSSTRSTNSSASPKYPNPILNYAQSWQDIHVPPHAKNVYKLPGLAYYAEAASILGQTMGRRGVDAIHAYILAGLYWGQLGHVLQSADWIHMAANAVIELLYSFPPADLSAPVDEQQSALFKHRPQEEKDRINRFLIAFWTVQQMEGDILAELERLPTSRLGCHLQIDGKSMGLPRDLVGVPNIASLALFNSSIDATHVLYHFLNQLTLRKYLNRAHLSLYSSQEQQREATTGRQRTLTWADLQPEELWQTVQNWREALPSPLQWSDSESPPTDILQARLRAKYYGFVYIVSRKVLEDVAQNNKQILAEEFQQVRNATLQALQNDSMTSAAVGCKRCILSAIASTVAFDNTCDGTRKRALLPNIMGTFTAQFSNMIVLSYCYLDPRLRGLLPNDISLSKLLQRTIRVLHSLSPLSPVFETNKQILLKAYEAVSAAMMNEGIKVEAPILDQRNLITGNSWPTPPNYGSPGVQSTGRSSQGPGTPRYDHITSANTSFNVPR